ncbi:MAG: 1-acyl-sn-glycerol-3-phosphate acyltransferase [Firmicutes bacterium HGW-Firmicutes-7]|nr:MAG: 1-acyl-sn-glycerol-3-phosphate acyltransferase [Firmicutes bacterium HGW-Firmicutes-7]
MIRAIVVLVLFIIFLIVTFPIVLFGFLVGTVSMKLRYKIARGIACFASNVFYTFSGSNITVNGLENVERNGKAVLFVGNHKSYMDIPLLIKHIPYPLAFIAKVDLKKVPFVSQVMTLLGCLFMDRANVRQSLEIIKEGVTKLKRGESLLIFPEGTRSKSNTLLPFKQGSLKLAEKANVLIIPFALKGTDELFGNHGFRITPSNVSLTFGAPIDLSQMSIEEKKKSAHYVQEIIQAMYLEMDKSFC